MYTLLGARVLGKTPGSVWESKNLTNTIVSQAFASLRRIVLKLKESTTNEEFFADLEQLRPTYASYGNTFGVLVQSIGSLTLVRLVKDPLDTIKAVRYSDARQSGYKVRSGVRNLILPDNYPVGDKHDLELVRPNTNTDMSLLHTHGLVSVNGYYHMSSATDDRFWVYNGMDSMLTARRNSVGVTSFRNVAELKKLPITADMISRKVADQPMNKGLEITIPEDEEHTTARGWFLVSGGYLDFPWGTRLYASGDKVVTLNLSADLHIARLLESRKFLDLSAMELTVHPQSSEIVNIAEALSDEKIVEYLTLSQSFLVFLDVDVLYQRKHSVRPLRNPGYLDHPVEPLYPLVVGHGRTTEYWKEAGDVGYSLLVQDKHQRDYLHMLDRARLLINVNQTLLPGKRTTQSDPFMLEIGSASFQEV